MMGVLLDDVCACCSAWVLSMSDIYIAPSYLSGSYYRSTLMTARFAIVCEDTFWNPLLDNFSQNHHSRTQAQAGHVVSSPSSSHYHAHRSPELVQNICFLFRCLEGRSSGIQ
jgi:hypothetical protein